MKKPENAVKMARKDVSNFVRTIGCKLRRLRMSTKNGSQSVTSPIGFKPWLENSPIRGFVAAREERRRRESEAESPIRRRGKVAAAAAAAVAKRREGGREESTESFSVRKLFQPRATQHD